MSRVSSYGALLKAQRWQGYPMQNSVCIFKDLWLVLQWWFMHICLPCPPGGCLGHGCVSPSDKCADTIFPLQLRTCTRH